MAKIVALRHVRRVIERQIESLRPYVDIDIRGRQQLEAEGCLVPYVPQELILTEIRFQAGRIDVIDQEITSLEGQAIGRAPATPSNVIAVQDAPRRQGRRRTANA
jgi:hypothetical protein